MSDGLAKYGFISLYTIFFMMGFLPLVRYGTGIRDGLGADRITIMGG